MGLPVPPANQPGAAMLDEAIQGSDHPLKPGQHPMVQSSPEGKVYAPPGWRVRDATGATYVKTTAYDVNTGWTVQTVP